MDEPPQRSIRTHHLNFRFIFIAASLLSLVILYVTLWIQMIASPVERTGADFMAFYAAGKIALTGDLDAVYDPQEQERIEESVLGFQIPSDELNPFVHPPFILPVLAVTALFPYEWAFLAWSIFLLISIGLSAQILIRTLPQGGESKLLFLSVILFFPAFVSLLNGQDTAILLLGASMLLYGLLNQNDQIAGIGLGLTTIRPHIAIMLALPFVFRRRNIFLWFCVTTVVLVVISIMMVGFKGAGEYINILRISASGEGFKINENAMVNFLGFLRQIVPDIPSELARLSSWVVFACAVVFLCIYWANSPSIDGRRIGTAILVAIFSVPHFHYHDLALLVIPLFCILATQREFSDSKILIFLPLVVSFVLLIGKFAFALNFIIPFLVMIGLLILLYRPSKSRVIFDKLA